MADENAQSPRAGWYPDPAGSAQQRWWDGSGWSASLRDAPDAPPAAPVERPRYGEHAPVAPPGAYGQSSSAAAPQPYAAQPSAQQPYGGAPAGQRDPSIKTGTPFIWIDVLLPLVSTLTIFLLPLDALVRAMDLNSTVMPTLPPEAAAASGVINLVGFLVYAASVVLGFLDWRALKHNGIQRPFHWAWSFLIPPWVYVIGRSVVVKRVTGTGLLPLWILIAVFAVQVLIAIGWATALTGRLMEAYPGGV